MKIQFLRFQTLTYDILHANRDKICMMYDLREHVPKETLIQSSSINQC